MLTDEVAVSLYREGEVHRLGAWSHDDGSRRWRVDLGEWEPEAAAWGPRRVAVVGYRRLRVFDAATGALVVSKGPYFW